MRSITPSCPAGDGAPLIGGSALWRPGGGAESSIRQRREAGAQPAELAGQRLYARPSPRRPSARLELTSHCALGMRAARSATSAALSVSSGSESDAMLTKESEHTHP
jgi:hypothetical protein